MKDDGLPGFHDSMANAPNGGDDTMTDSQAGRLASIRTSAAPAAIGPYSQAIVAGGWLFASGQIAIDPGSGKLVKGDITAQTERVMRNLSAILEAAGSSLDQVVKTTVYLADLDDFGAMNEVYARFMGNHRPARATVQVARLPGNAGVEIDAIAVHGETLRAARPHGS